MQMMLNAVCYSSVWATPVNRATMARGPRRAACCPNEADQRRRWKHSLIIPSSARPCLAHQVAQGLPYFEAYCAALAALRKSAGQIGTDLAALYGQDFQLIDSLRASDDDFSGIEIWGSAAFYR